MLLLIHLENAVSAFGASDQQLERLRGALPAWEVVRVASDREFLEKLPLADAVVVWKFPVEWYARAPRLRRVCTPSAGRELAAADPSGRVRRHFGSFHGQIMAESLLAMILFLKRRLHVALRAQEERSWERSPYVSTRGLRGETALILGFGAIGRHCARLLRTLGVTVHGFRRHSEADPDADRMFGPADLHEALGLADHIVCVLPGDTGTDGLLGVAEFERMKPTACVYNLGRGGAIDPMALMRALRARKLQGAYLDVVPEEPLPKESRLWSTPNLFLTPHCSAIRRDYLDLYLDELIPELAGEIPAVPSLEGP